MTIVRNLLAIIIGLVVGGGINMLIITFGAELMPPPAAVDPSDMESIKASMHLYGPEHFAAPFFAHAIGTLVGAFIAYLISVGRPSSCAYIVSAFFLVGGIVTAVMLPAPSWFIAVDLLLAYIPMAWLACLFGRKIKS